MLQGTFLSGSIFQAKRVKRRNLEDTEKSNNDIIQIKINVSEWLQDEC